MTLLGAGPNVSRVTVGPSTVDIRMGWAFHVTVPREAVVTARSLHEGLSALRGPLGLRVLRGVNYWRGTSLVNGAGTGLVEIRLGRPTRGRLGPFPARMSRFIVSAEDQPGLITALSRSTGRSPERE